MRIHTIISFAIFVKMLLLRRADGSGCPERSFLGCVLRLKAQRVPFERNMLAVVFKVDSEAKLKRTCSAYSNIMPCFRDKIDSCGDDKQRRLLKEVGKMIMYLCSPFSMNRQKQLMKHGKCIGEIFKHPVTTGCELREHHFSQQFINCRKVCSTRPTDFICMMKTWISEQNICTIQDIESKCSDEAAQFYVDMQSTVFDPLFPVICEYESVDLISSPVRTIVIDSVTTSTSIANSVVTLATAKPQSSNTIQTEKWPKDVRTTMQPTWLTTPFKKTRKENQNSSFLLGSLPKIPAATASKPVTVLSLFHKLFPMSSSIPNKLKSIVDKKFPIFTNTNQEAVKQDYGDVYSTVNNQTTNQIFSTQWTENSTFAPTATLMTVNPQRIYKIHTTTITTTSVPANIQFASSRHWKPWYLSNHVIPTIVPLFF